MLQNTLNFSEIVVFYNENTVLDGQHGRGLTGHLQEQKGSGLRLLNKHDRGMVPLPPPNVGGHLRGN